MWRCLSYKIKPRVQIALCFAVGVWIEGWLGREFWVLAVIKASEAQAYGLLIHVLGFERNTLLRCYCGCLTCNDGFGIQSM